MAGTLDVIDRLVVATNAHDIEALVDCFGEEYVNETPAHPRRGFRGREQVRRNWTTIFAGIPDITTTVRARVADGDSVWTELEMSGTRVDGTPHAMAGVIIFGVEGERISSARFYLEPIEAAGGTVDDAVAEVVRTRP